MILAYILYIIPVLRDLSSLNELEDDLREDVYHMFDGDPDDAAVTLVTLTLVLFWPLVSLYEIIMTLKEKL